MLLFLVFCLYLSSSAGSFNGGANVTYRLHKELFAEYSPEVRPCLDCSRSIEVSAYMNVAYVMSLDIKNQVLNLIGFLSFRWTDELLTWNPDDYQGIEGVFVKQDKVWRPDIAIYNSIDEKVYLGDDNLLVHVTYNGTVYWEPVLSLGVTCKVDIRKYPFDESICGINVTSWVYPETLVKLVAVDPPIRMSTMIPHSQYWVKAHDIQFIRSEIDDQIYRILVFRLRLTRRPSYLVMTLLVPVTLLSILCIVTFLLPPEVLEKTSMAITILLAYTVYLGIVDKELPETSEQMSHIVNYVDLLLFLSFLCVIGNAVVFVLHKREEKLLRVSRAKKIIYPLTNGAGGVALLQTPPVDTSDPPSYVCENAAPVCGQQQLSVSVQVKSKFSAGRVNKLFLLVNVLAFVSIVTMYFVNLLR